VQTPLAELVATLNRFRPVVLVGYASIIALLADEQDAGRLRLDPVLVVPTAEGLPEGEYERIARAFDAKVRNLYGATESGYAAYGCEHGWLHVNGDWVVLEPVDAEYRPVPPGTISHTMVLSNLANRVQPILRYDLGDRVIQRPDPCPCGNRLPAIRVQGRTADVLTFPTERGKSVAIPSLALELDQVPGIERAQVVQSRPTTLRLRLRPAAGSDPEFVWQAALGELRGVLTAHGLGHVAIERGKEPPQPSLGGKYRQVYRQTT
jgi:phenylacetate-coenzyme A ligase PaaK-like adenylate-forming protein